MYKKTFHTFLVVFCLISSTAFALLADLPAKTEDLDEETLKKQILRAGIIAELDAISFYEQMASLTSDPILKTVLLDIANEEKTHIGEFEALLLQIDPEQADEMEKGYLEVTELIEENT